MSLVHYLLSQPLRPLTRLVEHLRNAVRRQDTLRPDPQVVAAGGLHPTATALRDVRAEPFLDQPQEQCGLALLDPLLAPTLEPPPEALLDSRTFDSRDIGHLLARLEVVEVFAKGGLGLRG